MLEILVLDNRRIVYSHNEIIQCWRIACSKHYYQRSFTLTSNLTFINGEARVKKNSSFQRI
jgi:hypothetical protein